MKGFIRNTVFTYPIKGFGFTKGFNSGKGFQLGQYLKRLTFIVGEVMAVGQIDEPLATSFEILEGADTFAVDNSGNITFLLLPDYDTQRTYFLKVKSNRGYRYSVNVYVTVFLSDYIVTGDEIIYNDTYFEAA